MSKELWINDKNWGKKIIRLFAGSLLFFMAIISKFDAVVFLFIIPFTLYLLFNRNYKNIFYIILLLITCILIHNYITNEVSIQGPKELGVSFTENPLSKHTTILGVICQSIQTISYYQKFMFIPTQYYFYFG